jgi:uncharacterized protein YdaU (DUF1376 family)
MTENVVKIKAKGARFVRFYPSDWRSGCLGLSLEQEGLYVRICAFIYETNRRLPIDDCTAAKFMGAHTNAYRKVRDQLLDLGKITRCADGYTVARAERELEAAIGSSPAADQEGATNGPTHSAPKRNTSQDTIGDTPPDTRVDTPLDTPLVSHGVFSENVNQINGPSIEPKANSLKPKKETPKPPEGASADVIQFAKPVLDWRTAFGTNDDHAGVDLVDGSLVLVNGTRQFWLTEFGNDDRALGNALREAQATVNPGSRKSLKVQVEATLARIVRDMTTRQKNYLAAAAAKAAPKPVKLSRY